MTSLEVIISYVIREQDGLIPAKEFVESLRKNLPKKPAKLLVSVKCSDPNFLQQIKTIFGDFPKLLQVSVNQVPDSGYDLGSHYLIAKQKPNAVILFMSATTRIAHPNWFNLFINPFKNTQVGVVGCMLSFESIKDSYIELVRTRIKSRLHIQMSEFDLATAKSRNIRVSKIDVLSGTFGNWIANQFTRFFCYFYRNHEPLSYSNRFPSFPNPHLRTTGFAIRASLLLSVFDKFPNEKYEAFEYESGSSSISRRVQVMGFQTLHCDFKGKYESFNLVSNPSSFRVKRAQSLVTDRESRRYQFLDREVQEALTKITFETRHD
jgi:hypothetical protein